MTDQAKLRMITLSSGEWQGLAIMNTNQMVQYLQQLKYPSDEDMKSLISHFELIHTRLEGWRRQAKIEGLMPVPTAPPVDAGPAIQAVPLPPDSPPVQAAPEAESKPKGWPKGKKRGPRKAINPSAAILPPLNQ